MNLQRIASETSQSQEFKKGHSALRIISYLPGQQSQLLLMYLEAVHRSNFAEFRHEFTAEQVAALFQLEKRQVGSRLKSSVSQLNKAQVDIAPFENGSPTDYKFRSLFDKADYANGKFVFEVHPDVAPLVADALKSFALVDREVFLIAKSDYGVNLYQYLSRFKGDGQTWYERSIEELMFVFGIKDAKGRVVNGKKSYATPSKFLKYVLKRAIEDLHNLDSIKKLRFKEHTCQYTNETNLGIEVVRANNRLTSRIVKVIFHYEWLADDDATRPETPEETIKRIQLKGQALVSKGKRLGLSDIQELYRACSDINDVARMEILEAKIAELTRDEDDDEIEALKKIL